MLVALLVACHPRDPVRPAETRSGETGTSSGDTGAGPETDPPAPPTEVTDALQPGFGSLVVVSWRQDAPADAHLEFSVDEGVWSWSPVRSLGAGAHQELLLGVPYGAEVTYRVVLTRGDQAAASPDAVTRTADLPADIPAATVLAYDPARVDPTAPYALTTVGVLGARFWVELIDRQARVIWAYRSPEGRVTLHPVVARDGRSLFVDHDSFWAIFDGGAASEVAQLQLDGTVVHTFATPGLHHAFADLPDGSVAWSATDVAYDDETVRIVHPDGQVEDRFACDAWLATVGYGTCASNNLSYDPATDEFLLSLFSVETIVAVDGATGEVDRWFGHLDGSWAFDPPDRAFWWQHGAYVTAAGTLLTSSDLTSDGVETIVREYAFDDAGRTLREIWSAGVGEGIYGQYAGEAVRLDGGNTFHDYGELARLREFTPAGDVVWDVSWDTEYIGRTSPVGDLYALLPERP